MSYGSTSYCDVHGRMAARIDVTGDFQVLWTVDGRVRAHIRPFDLERKYRLPELASAHSWLVAIESQAFNGHLFAYAPKNVIPSPSDPDCDVTIDLPLEIVGMSVRQDDGSYFGLRLYLVAWEDGVGPVLLTSEAAWPA